MARIKSSPRQASRHSGDLYESGYQYRHPQRDMVWLGPWAGVQPFGVLGDPSRYLLDAIGVRLVDGSIRAAWGRTDTPVSNLVARGAFYMEGLNPPTHLGFYTDVSDMEYYINRITASTTDVVATGIASDADIQAALWGSGAVYFVDGGDLHKYVPAGTISTIAAGIINPFMVFELNNNLIVFGGTDHNDIYNSVDGDPEDFAGAGSAIHRFNQGLIFSGAKVGESIYAVGTAGAERITATGIGSPAFAYTMIPEIKTDTVLYGALGINGMLWFINQLGALCAYDGSSVRHPPTLNSLKLARMFYNSYINRIIAFHSDAGSGNIYLINPDTQEIETRMDKSGLLTTAAAPTAVTNQQDLVLYNVTEWSFYDVSSEADYTGTEPWFESEEFKFPGMVMVDEILLHRSGAIVPELTLVAYTREGAVTNYVLNNPVLDSRYCRYYVNAALDSFQLKLTGVVAGGEWDYFRMIKRIGVAYTLMDREQTTTT